MNICPFCNLEVIQNYNVVFDNFTKNYYHYSCYQKMVFFKLSSEIDYIKKMNNYDFIKYLFIDKKINLSELEIFALNDYFFSQIRNTQQPLTNLYHNFELENNSYQNLNSKLTQTDSNILIDDNNNLDNNNLDNNNDNLDNMNLDNNNLDNDNLDNDNLDNDNLDNDNLDNDNLDNDNLDNEDLDNDNLDNKKENILIDLECDTDNDEIIELN